MTVGAQLIKALIDSRSRHIIRGLSVDLFDDDEKPAFLFIDNHYRRYGELPTAEAMRDNGFALVPANDTVDYYFERTKERAVGLVLRQEHPAFVQAMRAGDVEAAGQALEAMLAGYRVFRNQSDTVNLRTAIVQVVEDFQEAKSNPGIRGVTTGWPRLDHITGGIAQGDIWAIVARPGVGKSYTMILMALAAWVAGHSVLFVSMEMTVLQNARRLVGMKIGTDPDKIRRGLSGVYVEAMMGDVLQESENLPPFYMVAGELSKSVRDVDSLMQQYSPDITFVDAAYLLDPDRRSGRYAKHELLQDVLKGIKSLAMSRDRGIVISVQFNKEGKKFSSLENIGGSDWVGQVSSVVLGMREGIVPHEDTRRVYSVLKNRESRGGQKFETNFLFSPFSMKYLHEVRKDGTPNTESNAQLRRRML